MFPQVIFSDDDPLSILQIASADNIDQIDFGEEIQRLKWLSIAHCFKPFYSSVTVEKIKQACSALGFPIRDVRISTLLERYRRSLECKIQGFVLPKKIWGIYLGGVLSQSALDRLSELQSSIVEDFVRSWEVRNAEGRSIVFSDIAAEHSGHYPERFNRILSTVGMALGLSIQEAQPVLCVLTQDYNPAMHVYKNLQQLLLKYGCVPQQSSIVQQRKMYRLSRDGQCIVLDASMLFQIIYLSNEQWRADAELCQIIQQIHETAGTQGVSTIHDNGMPYISPSMFVEKRLNYLFKLHVEIVLASGVGLPYEPVSASIECGPEFKPMARFIVKKLNAPGYMPETGFEGMALPCSSATSGNESELSSPMRRRPANDQVSPSKRILSPTISSGLTPWVKSMGIGSPGRHSHSSVIRRLDFNDPNV